MIDKIYQLLEQEINGEEIRAFAAEYQKYPLHFISVYVNIPMICKGDDRFCRVLVSVFQRMRGGGSRIDAVQGFPPGAAI